MSRTTHHSTLPGRASDQELLRDALAGAMRGAGRVVLVSGDAGIGKTTLVSWLRSEAGQHGLHVMYGACYDHLTTPPFAPWFDAVERFRRSLASSGALNLPDNLIPAVAEFRQTSTTDVFEQIGSLLDSLQEQGPLVLILEDIHWADLASIELLRFVTRYVRESNLLVVATHRPSVADSAQHLFVMLPVIVRETQATRIDLRPLESADIATLLESRYPLALVDHARVLTYLVDRSEGNPLLLGEILRELESRQFLYAGTDGWEVGDIQNAGVPPLVKQIVQRRVLALSDQAQRMLGFAAVIGSQVALDQWERVCSLDTEDFDAILREVLHSQVMLPDTDGSSLRFQHALVQEALYQALPPGDRRRMHAVVGEALLGRNNPDPDIVAHHLQASGDPRAPEWLVRAGIRALDTNGWHAAAERFRLAARLLESAPEQQRRCGWLLFMSGFLLRYSNSYHALPDLDGAERLAIATGDAVLLGCTHYHRGASRAMRGDVRDGLLELERGVDELDNLVVPMPVADTADVALAEIRSMLPEQECSQGLVPGPAGLPSPQRGILLIWLSHAGQFQRARQMGEQFLERMATLAGDDHLRVYQCIAGYLGIGHAYGALGLPSQAKHAYDTALEWFGRSGIHVEEQFTIWSDLMFLTIPYRTTDLAARQRLSSLAARNWARSASLSVSGPDDAAPGKMLVDLLEGRWESVRRSALESRKGTYSLLASHATAVLALVSAWQGEHELAWECVHEILPDGYATVPGNAFYPNVMTAHSAAVNLLLSAGEHQKAARWLDANRQWLAWGGTKLWVADYHLMMSMTMELAGDVDEALRHGQAALQHASHPRQPLTLASSLRRLGELAIVRQELATAECHLTAALALADECDVPFERARTMYALARLSIAASDGSDADMHLQAAERIAVDLGARPFLAQIRMLREQLESCIHPEARPHALSPREVEVIAQIVDGKSNRDIAENLYISPRTVANHVASIMNKLGVNSRTAAAAWAIRHGVDRLP